MTKDDLLTAMREFNACAPAITWVEAQEGDAAAIWGKCEEHGWLIWFAAHALPDELGAFAQRLAAKMQDGDWRLSCSNLVPDGTFQKQCAAAALGACDVSLTPPERAKYARLAASISVAAKRSTMTEQLAEMHALWHRVQQALCY